MTRIEEIRKRLEEQRGTPLDSAPTEIFYANAPSDIAFLLEEVRVLNKNFLAMERNTARRCAEIAEENCQEDECGGFIASAILREFGL